MTQRDWADEVAEKIGENLKSCGLLARILIVPDREKIADLLRASQPSVTRLVETLVWIAKRYDDRKNAIELAQDAYEMSSMARSALSTIETEKGVSDGNKE